MTNYSKSTILEMTDVEKDIFTNALSKLTTSLIKATEIKSSSIEVSAETESVSFNIPPKSKYTGWKKLKLEVEYKEN